MDAGASSGRLAFLLLGAASTAAESTTFSTMRVGAQAEPESAGTVRASDGAGTTTVALLTLDRAGASGAGKVRPAAASSARRASAGASIAATCAARPSAEGAGPARTDARSASTASAVRARHSRCAPSSARSVASSVARPARSAAGAHGPGSARVRTTSAVSLLPCFCCTAAW